MKRSSTDLDILAAFLDEAARLTLEAEVGSDEVRRKTIEESYRLKKALERGGAIDAREVDELLLALAAVGDNRLSGTWRARIRASVGESAAAAEKVGRIQRRVHNLEKGSDAGHHFARLTGHEATSEPSRRGLWLAAASVFLMVLAHGIFQGFAEDPVRRAAWSQVERPRASRSATLAASDLQRAGEMVLASRRTVLGMWPRYDQALLVEAERLLTGREDPAAILLRAQIQAAAGQFEASLRTLDSAAQSPEPVGWKHLREILALQSIR